MSAFVRTMLKKLAVLRLQVIVVKPCGVLTQSSLCVQVPIKLLHPVFGRFEHLAETAQPSLASLDFVHTVCAQAKYYYASEEKDYQQVMRNIWKHALSHLGGVTRRRKKLNTRFGIIGQYLLRQCVSFYQACHPSKAVMFHHAVLCS